MQNKNTTLTGGVFGTAEGIRTPDLLVRSQTLYPTELQPHMLSKQLIYITTGQKEMQAFF